MVASLNIPEELVQIIRNMYVYSIGISFDANTGDFFEFLANLGVKQGDGASPKLFGIFFDQVYPYLLKHFNENMVAAKLRCILEISTLQVFFLCR